MRCERRRLDGDPAALVAEIRALVPDAGSVASTVADILEDVRGRGDEAVLEYTRRFDTRGAEPRPLRVDPGEADAALAALDPEVRVAIQTAIANVGEFARAGLRADREVVLAQGQRIVSREVPVRRAAVYVPGGRAPYPSTVVMGAVTARAAGVDEVVVCAPPRPDGEADPVVLAACALCRVDEILRMGGAQAIAALAQGSGSVARVDVIVGPGNLYVQEAKRQVADRVGIDGFAGPSDLLVVLDDGVPAEVLALDLLAQAEHGAESLVLAASPSSAALDALEEAVARLATDRPTATAGACVLVETADLPAALAFAEAYAPEHLQLAGAGPEALASHVRNAGCVLVGAESGTAFGDYVAGSNHCLPTGGAARFASALSVDHFRRRVAEVRLGDAAPALARVAAPLARAEGFVVHAESMEARIRDDGAA